MELRGVIMFGVVGANQIYNPKGSLANGIHLQSHKAISEEMLR